MANTSDGKPECFPGCLCDRCQNTNTQVKATAARRPWPPPSLESMVNDEMRQAARGAAICSGYLPYDDGVNEAIYRAMRPLEPSTSITVVTEDVLGQRNTAWERIRYLEAVVANMPTAESVKAMLADKDARISELKSELAGRPSQAALSFVSTNKEVRPHQSCAEGSIHLVRHVDGRAIVWTWFPKDGHGGGWQWIDPNTLLDDHLNGYSGLEGHSTGPQDAYSEGWRYCRPATPAAFVDPEPPKLEHNPFKDHGHDPRRMGPL